MSILHNPRCPLCIPTPEPVPITELGPKCPACESYEVVEEYPNEYLCKKCDQGFWVYE